MNYTDELLQLSRDEFDDIVSDDIKDALDPGSVAALRSPVVLPRWLVVLESKRIDYDNKRQLRWNDVDQAKYAGSATAEDIAAEIRDIKNWEARSYKFRQRLEMRYSEAAALSIKYRTVTNMVERLVDIKNMVVETDHAADDYPQGFMAGIEAAIKEITK